MALYTRKSSLSLGIGEYRHIGNYNSPNESMTTPTKEQTPPLRPSDSVKPMLTYLTLPHILTGEGMKSR